MYLDILFQPLPLLLSAIIVSATVALIWGVRLARTVRALTRAVELHSASQQARVLVIYSGDGSFRNPLPLLRRCGWAVEGDDLGRSSIETLRHHVAAMMRGYDVLVLAGFDAAQIDALGGAEWFREARVGLAGVILYTPDSRRVFYDLGKWYDEDQAVTTPATCQVACAAAAALRARLVAEQ